MNTINYFFFPRLFHDAYLCLGVLASPLLEYPSRATALFTTLVLDFEFLGRHGEPSVALGVGNRGLQSCARGLLVDCQRRRSHRSGRTLRPDDGL